MSITAYIKDAFINPSRYTKFWVAFLTAILNALATFFPDAPWLPIVVTFLGSLGVFALPNKK